MTEQEKPKGKSSGWKSWFVAEEETISDKPANLPVPAAIPGQLAPVVVPQAVVPTVDQGMVDRIRAELEASAPAGYKDFVGDLATLADTLPTEELLYRSALKLVSKQGHTVAGLALDYEKCQRLLDEQGRLFDASVQDQITAKVGKRQAEVARLDGDIAKLNEQLAQLQSQRDAEAAAIETDTARIETTKLKFQGAFAVVMTQLNDQKSKLAAFGK